MQHKTLIGIGICGFCALAIVVTLAYVAESTEPQMHIHVAGEARQARYIVAGGEASVVHGQYLMPLIKEAYEKIGIKIDYKALPSLRSLEMANSVYDAEMGRTPAYIKEYERLTVVPVQLTTFNANVYTHDPSIHIKHIDDLNKYTIARRRGVKLLDQQFANHPDCIIVHDLVQMVELLAIKRIDVVLAVEMDFNYAIYELQTRGKKVPQLYYSTLFKSPIFHPINKKNSDLIPDLSRVLEDMVKGGEFQRRFDELFDPVRDMALPIEIN